ERADRQQHLAGIPLRHGPSFRMGLLHGRAGPRPDLAALDALPLLRNPPGRRQPALRLSPVARALALVARTGCEYGLRARRYAHCPSPHAEPDDGHAISLALRAGRTLRMAGKGARNARLIGA